MMVLHLGVSLHQSWHVLVQAKDLLTLLKNIEHYSSPAQEVFM